MIEEFKPGEEIPVSELVLRAFELFISPDYPDEGRDNFRVFADADAVLERFQGGDLILCSKEADRILGVLDVRNGR